MNKNDKINTYCDGCENLRYDALENFTYCKLGKKPRPHLDEPDSLYCNNRKDSFYGD